MAHTDLARGRLRLLSQPRKPPNPTISRREYPRTWRRIAIEVAGTFLVLVGMAVGVLTLRFALLVMHDVVH